MQPRVVTVGPLAAASANNIALSQSPAGAGNLTLNGSTVSGGVATLDVPRQVIFTSSGNDSARTLTVTGTDWSGTTQTETLAGGNGATLATTALAYLTITKVSISGATAGTITAGTNGVGISPWINLDPWALGSVSGQCVPVGTANFTVQVSNDDPNSYGNPVLPSLMAWDSTAAGVTGASAEVQFGLSYAPAWMRVILNSGSGSVRMTLIQHGAVPY